MTVTGTVSKSVVQPVAGTGGSGGSGGEESALLDGLISWWAMDETSGNRADSHTNGYDLIEYNGVGYAAGKVSNAADFRDYNDQLYYSSSSDDHPFDDMSEFSLFVWIRADSFSSGGFADDIVNVRDDTGSANIAWSLQYSGPTYGLKLYVPDGSGTEHADGGALSDSTWYGVYAYWKGADSEIGISVNNSTIVTATGPSTMNDVGPLSNYLRVGSGPSTANDYDGRIDELAIWNRKLNSTEVTNLNNSGDGIGYPS